MVDFSTSLQNTMDKYKKNKKTYTENGAKAYLHSHKAITDMNFNITNLRNEDWDTIGKEFSDVFYEEDISIAIKYLFLFLDMREGLGERNISKGILKWLIDNHCDILEKVYKYIPEYGRWDILILLADPQFNSNKSFRNRVVYTIKDQIFNDLEDAESGKSISLLGKWMPSENASSKETRRLARQLINDLNFTPRMYRKFLSKLRKALKVVECDMSANKWSDINYEHVPSKANLNYSNAFMKHDEEGRSKYLESLKNGKVKINASVLAPYEIVSKYFNLYSINSYDEALEQMWKNLPQYQMNDILVVRDGSGSMTCTCTGNTTCLDVATSLAIYAAEHNSKNWKDKFITFSSEPEFVDMSKCSSLREKLVLCQRYNDCSNTDIYSTMKLILNVAKKNRYKQSQMPKAILIVSDMQFDTEPNNYYWTHRNIVNTFNYDNTLFESIQKEYKKNGYSLPKIIFWNVDSRGNKTIPMQENELGLTLVSGFSANIFKMVLSEDLDPYKQLLSILNSERYEPIEKALLS